MGLTVNFPVNLHYDKLVRKGWMAKLILPLKYLFYLCFNKFLFNKSVVLVDPNIIINSIKGDPRFKKYSFRNKVVSGNWDLCINRLEPFILTVDSLKSLELSNMFNTKEIDGLKNIKDITFISKDKLISCIRELLQIDLSKEKEKLILECIMRDPGCMKYSPQYHFIKAVYEGKDWRHFYSWFYGDHKYESEFQAISKLMASIKTSYNYPHKYWEYKDMVVCSIGRNGEIFFEDGRHRTYCSAVLGIERIPIAITARHKEWISFKRKYIASLIFPSSSGEIFYTSNPDLHYLVDNPIIKLRAMLCG